MIVWGKLCVINMAAERMTVTTPLCCTLYSTCAITQKLDTDLNYGAYEREYIYGDTLLV